MACCTGACLAMEPIRQPLLQAASSTVGTHNVRLRLPLSRISGEATPMRRVCQLLVLSFKAFDVTEEVRCASQMWPSLFVMTLLLHSVI